MVVLESKVQQLYDLVHAQHQHFTVHDAQKLHDILSFSKGRVTAKVMEYRYNISSTLVMQLKEKYK